MILMRILPGVLKELAKHVPAVLFETVEWTELAGEIPKLSRRMIQKEGYKELFDANQELLDSFGVNLIPEALPVASMTDHKLCGERLLTIYFVQLFSTNGVFLDLRYTHFHDKDGTLDWNPSGLWTKLEENFRQGLLKVYEGFYLEKDEIYYRGLEEIGLLRSDFSREDKQQLGELFRAQFGGALNQEMSFDLAHLRNSIIGLSNFMLEKKVSISKDFLYLGIYLVTLYSTLERLGNKYPVKKIYLEVRNCFESPG